MRSWLLASLFWLAVAPGVAAAARTKVAVLDVRASGKGLEAGTVEPLSALLASEVARRPDLEVASGADLRTMIGFEKQKQALGCADASCLAEIGGALGVDFLVASEVSVFGGSFLLSLSLIEVGKARSTHRLTRREPTEKSLLDAVPAAVAELVGRIPVSPAATPPVATVPEPVPAQAVSRPPERAAPESSVLPWVSVGLGAVAVVAGGVLYGGAFSEAKEPVYQSEADAGDTRAALGLGLLGAGTVAVAGGLIFAGGN